ncbi:MAG TPA: ferredoxin [Candidatus Paceibacterota bacterium]
MASDTNDTNKNKKRIGRIYVDRDLCIGAASCVAIAPGVFALDKENKAFVVDEHGADQETIMLAAQSCPTRAIFLYDEDGNQIYP